MGWQDIAREAAAAVGLDYKVLAATVEAETGGSNIVGDGGEATGYGQVWLTWHDWRLNQAAGMLGLELPSGIEARRQAVLNNDQLSMYLAALVTKGYWDATGGDWEAFTKRYVGPGIPDSDLERRRVIWERYQGNAGATGGLQVMPVDGQAVLIVGLSVAAVLAILGGSKGRG